MSIHHLDPDGWGRLDGYGRVKVEVDFGVGYQNVTGYCAGFTVNRGRSQRLGQFYAGQAMLRLDNRDSRFSPWNIDTPYTGPDPVPVARPNTPLRILGRTPSGAVTSLFTGWADAWTENVDVHKAGRTSAEWVDVTATDGFKRLAQAVRVPVAAVGAGELAGARINRILTSALWPSGLRYVTTGQVTMQATTLSGSALDELHATAMAEGGLFFMDGAGRATFLDRATVDSLAAHVEYTFTNSHPTAGSIPFVNTFSPNADDSALLNTVTIARAGGPSSTAQDSASQSRNGLLVFSRTDLPHESDAVSSELAGLYLGRLGGLEFGIQRLELNPYGSRGDERSRAWSAVVSLEPLHAIRVVYQSATPTASMTASAPMDEVRHAVTTDTWSTTVRTSPLSGSAVPGPIETLDPPTNLRVTSRSGTSICWAWDNDPDGYDYVFVRLDGNPPQIFPGTRQSFCGSGFTPDSDHTLCVSGRVGLVNSGEVCLTATTVAAPGPQTPPTDGPPGPGEDPGGEFPIPDPGATCSWHYTLSRIAPPGVTILDEPFDSLANWSGTGATLVTGRTGTGMRVAGSTFAMTYSIPSTDWTPVIRLDLWWAASAVTGATRPICQLRASGSNNVATFMVDATAHVIALNGGTTGVIVGTSTATVAVNTWNRLTVEVAISPTAGYIAAWLNDVQFCNATGLDTQPATETLFQSILLGGAGSGQANTFDDLLLSTPGTTSPTGDWLVIDSGTVPADQIGETWRPTGITWVPEVVYKICFDKVCTPPEPSPAGPTCYQWQEPPTWSGGDPCIWPPPPEPEPLAALEVCGPENIIADVLTGAHLNTMEMYSNVWIGPYGGDDLGVVAVPAPPDVTGQIAWGHVGALRRVGSGPGPDDPGDHVGLTVAGWVYVPALPPWAYPVIYLGTDLTFGIWLQSDAGINTKVFVVAYDYLGRRNEWDLGIGVDAVPMGVWVHVAVAYGIPPEDPTLTSGGIRLWINGNPESLTDIGEGFLLRAHDDVVALSAQSGGMLAHWAVWDRLLTDAEVLALATV